MMTTSVETRGHKTAGNAAATGILVEGLTKSFADTQVLREIDLAVEPGSMLALLGPNGAGKTTIVRILTTLLRPDAGRILVGGHDVISRPDQVRRVIGLTGQDTSVDSLLTGRENLVMIGRLFRLGLEESRRRAGELLEKFDLQDAGDRAVRTYSGGMRRRLDLAVSLVATPTIMFLDEPTTGLDPLARQKMWVIIRDLMDAGTTVLLTTQYLEEADHLADRIAVIDEGRIIVEGTPDSLKGQFGSEHARFSFTESNEYHAAQALLTDVGAIGSESTRTIEFSIADPWQLHAILGRLHESGLKPANLSVTQPTLDDVFFKVTGAQSATAETEES